MKRRSFLTAAGAIATTLPAPAIHAQGANRGVALVIGNSKYSWEASLPNVRRDAPDVARRFQALGLKTELVENATMDAMKKALGRLAAGSRGAEFSAFYFAGHGVFQKNSTSLVPVDGDLSTPDNLKTMPQVYHVVKAMNDANCRFVVLDACRNNPSDGWRQREALDAAFGNGPQAVSPRQQVNTRLLFSTMPGRAALDGPAGDNSPFAAALLRQLGTGSVDLEALPAVMRRDLMIATQGRQVLVDYGVLERPFRLAGKPAPSAPHNTGDSSRVVEITAAYKLAKDHGLTILPGLVAYRSNTPDAARIGSYSYTLGGSNPFVLAILSVEDPQAVDILLTMSTKASSQYWRLTQGKLAGDTLDFTANDGGPRFIFKWGNPDSGSVTFHPPSQAQGTRIASGKFSRIG